MSEVLNRNQANQYIACIPPIIDAFNANPKQPFFVNLAFVFGEAAIQNNETIENIDLAVSFATKPQAALQQADMTIISPDIKTLEKNLAASVPMIRVHSIYHDAIATNDVLFAGEDARREKTPEELDAMLSPHMRSQTRLYVYPGKPMIPCQGEVLFRIQESFDSNKNICGFAIMSICGVVSVFYFSATATFDIYGKAVAKSFKFTKEKLTRTAGLDIATHFGIGEEGVREMITRSFYARHGRQETKQVVNATGIPQ